MLCVGRETLTTVHHSLRCDSDACVCSGMQLHCSFVLLISHTMTLPAAPSATCNMRTCVRQPHRSFKITLFHLTCHLSPHTSVPTHCLLIHLTCLCVCRLLVCVQLPYVASSQRQSHVLRTLDTLTTGLSAVQAAQAQGDPYQVRYRVTFT